MSTTGFTDKSMLLESAFGGWALDRRAFSEPGVEANYPPSRSFDIAAYHLALWIDPEAQSLRGEATISVKGLAGQGGELVLDLDSVVVDQVTGLDGASLAWRHADGKLRIAHADVVTVAWHGSPRRGLYFVGPTPAEPNRDWQAWTQCQDEDAHHIFPCLDHPSVKHPWRVRIHAPPGFVVVGNGRREGEEWVVEAPMPAYLFSAVVARLDVHHAPPGSVPVAYYVPAGTPAPMVQRAFHKTPAMIEFLAAHYGAYPWSRYDQVVVYDFIFGGMENLAATTLIDVVMVDETAALDSDMDSLVVHELGHQWWGDLVTCQDWSQGWLNEGWATYTETLWFHHDRGVDEGRYHLWEHLLNYLGEDGGRYRRPIVSYKFKNPIDLFDRHLYEKGALVLHTLRTVLGDEAFWAAVRLYLGRHGGGTVHTRHLQRAFEDASGQNLDRFFDQYVFGAGHPQLKVELGHTDGQLKVAVKQTQEGECVASAFAVPLTVSLAGVRHTLALDARERTFLLPCPTAPAWVSVDADFGLLAEITLSGPVSMLAAALVGDPNIIGRIRAAKALGAEGSPAALAALTAAMRKEPSWCVRVELPDVLAATGAAPAVEALLAALADADARVRRRVVAALAAFRRDEVVAALVALRPDPSIHVRGEVARVLGKLRAPQARAACERLLPESSWCELLRARALEGLGATRDAEVLPTLLAWTAVERPARARAAAASALARLGDDVEVTRTAAVERLQELAEDANYRVQVSAINALGVLRDPRCLGTLTRLHRAAGDARCRRLAFDAMANVREGRTVEGAFAGLRREVEGLSEDNRKLRDRLTRLESKA